MFDFLVMAQREHKRLGVTLTDSHQKQPAQRETGDTTTKKNKKSVKTSAGVVNKNIHVLHPALPVYLSLLVDDAMGFFSGYPAVEPQLSHVDDCRTHRGTLSLQNVSVKSKSCQIQRLFGFLVHVPEFNDE